MSIWARIHAARQRGTETLEGKTMIQLGDRVRDRISGLEGIVVGITDWLYQCRRPIVQPTTLKDGQPADSVSFDEPQLEVIERAAFAPHVQEPEPAAKTGGPRDTPARRSDPSRR